MTDDQRDRLAEMARIAEALDDLISERGVTLDDARLDWLTEHVVGMRAEARAEALQEAAGDALHDLGSPTVAHWLRARARAAWEKA